MEKSVNGEKERVRKEGVQSVENDRTMMWICVNIVIPHKISFTCP